jgi:hypothetical protein
MAPTLEATGRPSPASSTGPAAPLLPRVALVLGQRDRGARVEIVNVPQPERVPRDHQRAEGAGNHLPPHAAVRVAGQGRNSPTTVQDGGAAPTRSLRPALRARVAGVAGRVALLTSVRAMVGRKVSGLPGAPDAVQ